MMKSGADLLQRYRSLRILIALLIVVVGVYAFQLIWSGLSMFGDVILVFFLAWVFAFLLSPVSLFMQSRGLSRLVSVSFIYLALLVVSFSLVIIGAPILAQQVSHLANEVTDMLSPTSVASLTASAVLALQRLGIGEHEARAIVDNLMRQAPGWLGQLGAQALGATASALTSLLGILFNVFLILVLSFYMMLDGGQLVERVVVRLPGAWIPDVRLFQRYVVSIFGGFFRSQLIIGAIYGVFTWLALVVLGQANGLLIALLAGLLMLIPFIGPFLAVAPPIALIMLQAPQNEIVAKVLILIVLLFVAQQITMQLIAPRLFGDSMGIHPLVFFAALLIGSRAAGVWGAFFAGPIAAVATAMLLVFYDRVAATSLLFQPPETAAEDEAPVEAPAAEIIIGDPALSHARIPKPPFSASGYDVAEARRPVIATERSASVTRGAEPTLPPS